MKRIVVILTLTVMIVLGSALPALAQNSSPPQPDCGWYLDRYIQRTFGVDWYGYWCDWGQDNGGWVLYGWWSADSGWIPVS